MITFDPQKHVYTNSFTGEEYVSVTTLLNRFKKPFDSKSAAERVAQREGKTPEEIQKLWKDINSESKKRGTEIHNVIEKYIKQNTITKGYENLIESYNSLNIANENNEILSEEKLYSHRHKLAGTTDIIRLESKGGFSIFDIKTNKKFNFFSPYGEKLLAPLNHLPSCEYTIYSLQLSLYAYMYQELTGRHVNQLGVLYYNISKNNFDYYPTVYMKQDIISLLKHYEKS